MLSKYNAKILKNYAQESFLFKMKESYSRLSRPLVKLA